MRRLATVIMTLVLTACAASTANPLSPEMERLLGKDFDQGVGYVLGMAPIGEFDFAWCGRPDVADLMDKTMRTAITRSMCISDQEKQDALHWLTAFRSTVQQDVRRYVDARGRLPDRLPWSDSSRLPGPLCASIISKAYIEQLQQDLARDLTNSEQLGRTQACHTAAGP
jgi:hypothetical protein